MEAEQEIIIPYFRFCESTPASPTAGSFLMKVYIDKQSHPYVSLDVNGSVVTVSTRNKSPKLYSAKYSNRILRFINLCIVLPEF